LPAPVGHSRVQVELLDAAGVVCLDADNFVRFGHAGDGRLIDDLGTVGGSRKVQLANGRARIDVAIPSGGQAAVSVQIDGVPTQFIRLHALSTKELEARKNLASTPAETRVTQVA